MTKQTIEVEGLPEGCEAIAVQFDPNYFNKYTGDDGYIYFEAKVKVKKIQPRRIVLEETEEDNKMYESGLYETQVFNDGLRLHNNAKKWRVAKENDIPLTNDDFNLKIGDIFYTLPKSEYKSWRGTNFRCLEIREDCVIAEIMDDIIMRTIPVTLMKDKWEFKKK